MTLQHSASGLHNQNAQRNSSFAIINTENPKYPMTTNNKQNGSASLQPIQGKVQQGINASYNGGFNHTQGKSHMKLPGARAIPVDDLPSDISADEWGEIQKFG